MTKRSDIIDGSEAIGRKFGLIYTKKCGWIDLGHANPKGAGELWIKIKQEKDEGNAKPGYFRISYSQMMGNKHVKVGIRRHFDILRGSTLEEKKSVALAIFLDVSSDFEDLQGNWLFRTFTNSSFSAEDLVSNLVGFYRAVDPLKQYIQICQPVSKDIAMRIWDTYGPVGDNKNYSTVPYVYPLSDSSHSGPMSVPLPPELDTIKPAKQGRLFKKVK